MRYICAMALLRVTIKDDSETLLIELPDKSTVRFHALWLRDNDQGASARDTGNGQRLFSILDLPADIRIVSAEVSGTNTLHIQFSDRDIPIEYSLSWLLEHRYDKLPHDPGEWMPRGKTIWDSNTTLPRASQYSAIADSKAALLRWLQQVTQFGFARLAEVPRQGGSICQIAELFGYVRETNYGRFFDVRSEIDPSNLAYTNRGLEVHTDNPYRDPVPTLQLLACLENSAEGGESIVVDGFKACDILWNESPDHFRLLSSYNANFAYLGGVDTRLRSYRPMIETGSDGRLRAIRFNSRSIAALTQIPYDDMSTYYEAYRHLAEIVNRPGLQHEFKLEPGELFMVDNTRVLHARKAFSGTGNRWLQGCYADLDSLNSTLEVLQEGTFAP